MGRNWGPKPKWAHEPWFGIYGFRAKAYFIAVYVTFIGTLFYRTHPKFKTASLALLPPPEVEEQRQQNKKQSTMAANTQVDYKDATSMYEFTANSIRGEPVALSKYRDHVCLVVNVASKCGLAKDNYAELNELYDSYGASKGLRILAFPCNQFAGQEPGTNEEICELVRAKDLKFDVFEKVDVNGENAHPLWKYMKHKVGGTLGSFIKWNFTKFIVDRQGQPVERHGPNTNPKELIDSLEKIW